MTNSNFDLQMWLTDQRHLRTGMTMGKLREHVRQEQLPGETFGQTLRRLVSEQASTE